VPPQVQVVTVVKPGFRCSWLICDGCSRRVTKLYQDGDTYRCRLCLGLWYQCQAETKERKRHRFALQKAQKLRMLLKAEPDVLLPPPPRPPRMTLARYQRLLAELLTVEERLFAMDIPRSVKRGPPLSGG
jgi:hypothetical protein